MPVYDLACKSCDEVTEAYIPLSDFDKELTPCACGGHRFRKVAALQVMTDIQPYQAMGTDIATGTAPMITSRAHHREYLKRNGYEEVGNEMPKPRATPEVNTREIGHQIKQVIDQKGIKL